ncbi:MEI1 protein [Trifolium medium]|uniref:MEI1 protein n=1 Tax=Trifolium medium TaxID=97028 RepID=A0A392LXN5_9FABA|nr:MEI1 protein [Trifolium medium]
MLSDSGSNGRKKIDASASEDVEFVEETPQQQHLDDGLHGEAEEESAENESEEETAVVKVSDESEEERVSDESVETAVVKEIEEERVEESEGETVVKESEEEERVSDESEETVEEKSDESIEDSVRQQNIDNACHLLVKIGFKRGMFTLENIYEHGLTDDEFLETIKPIAPITDMEELKLVTMISRLTYDNFRVFIDRMRFLNSSTGSYLVVDAVDRIEKKKNLEMNKGDLVRAQKMVDYANSRREYGKRLSDQIEDLAKKKKELVLEYVKIEKNLEKNLGPLRAYEELSMDELEFQAYQLYENDCKSKGEHAITDELGVSTAMEKFGEAVKERHFVDFSNVPSRKVEIEKHLKKKIMRFEYADKKHGDAGGESSKTAAKIVVYKFGSDVCEGAESYDNFVVNDTRDDETAAKIIYKFGSDVLEGGGSGNHRKKKRKRVETRDLGKE